MQLYQRSTGFLPGCPRGCVQAGPELMLLGIASPCHHQKQPVSLPLARGEQPVGLSPEDPIAAPRQAAGLQSPCEGMPLPWGSTEQGREAGVLLGWETCLGLGEEPAFSRHHTLLVRRQSVQLKGGTLPLSQLLFDEVTGPG